MQVTQEKLIVTNEKDGHYVFKKEWIHDDKNGGMIFTNKAVIAEQKKVFKFLLKQMGVNVLQGKSILNISLPIGIFDTRSNLERFAYSYSFAPVYLERAAQLTDPVEQMKQCVPFLLTTTLMYLELTKPFNPILGETFQGWLNGCPIYCEQISHHPPICAFQLYGRGYHYHGSQETTASMGANSVTGRNLGELQVDFQKTNNTIHMLQASGAMGGITMGERTFNVTGKAYLYDPKNMLYCEIAYNPDKKGFFSLKKQQTLQDFFQGAIYKVKEEFMKKVIKSIHSSGWKGIHAKDDSVAEKSKISGTWNQELEIDGKKLFTIDSPFPYQLEYEKYPLASDGTFREDLVSWKLKDVKLAQTAKDKLENIQRADRKLRQKFVDAAKKAKKWYRLL